MIAPSPAPKRKRRLVWPWVLVGLLVFIIVAVGLAWWLVPPWLERVATERVTSTLRNKLDQPVTVGEVEMDLPTVVFRDLVVGDPEAPIVRLDEVTVTLDRDALWSGRAEPVDARVRGGMITGERDTLTALAKRLRRRAPTEEPERKGRVRLVPERLSIRGLGLDVWQGDRDQPQRHIEATIRLAATPAEGKASVTLQQLRVDDPAVGSVRAASVKTELVLPKTEGGGRTLRFPLAVEVEGVGTQLTPEIAVAGVDGHITVADILASEIAVDLEGGFSDRDDSDALVHLWSVTGRLRRDLSEGQLEIAMDAFELGRVPEVLARLPLVDSQAATVGGRIALVFGAGLAQVEGRVRVDGVNVAHPLLARDTVRDVGFDLELAAEIDPKKPRLVLHHANIERRNVQLRLSGEILHPSERSDRRYQLHAEVAPTPCQQVLEAIPAAMVPSLQGFSMGGTFSLGIDVDVDFADLDALVLNGGVGLAGCTVEQRPARAAAERLARGFTHRVTMRDGRLRAVHLYSGSSGYTPLSQISPHMVQAVLTTEDGGFWRHKGFLPSQFRTALRRNLEAGRVRLGASTITMQMVKNVLLSHERTLARKLQEMILTWYVETALSKERIMEIYLNIVELGPGIYGVTRASQHYFGKHPAHLTPPEAVYLALMLPSPVRRHSNYCRGKLSSSFEVKVARILRIMNERRRLDDLEYEIWKEVPVEFDLRERRDSGSCLGEINALMEASEGQRALTGLLARPGDGVFHEGGGPSGDLSVVGDSDLDPANADAPGTPAMDDRLGEP
ncbi:MAG: transglycosylase domain-containing protein [Deltaproteobacteria bacterium]|nr:transglycosylase domain-containing protein [Deltaproteobacteria bacterium]